ncbi:MAG: CapA family protein [Thermodesulfobacteriota bacterium]
MLNWEKGIWQNEHVHESEAEVLIASDWAPIRKYSDIILNDPEAVYGNLLPVMRDSDIRIANLECPLCEKASPAWKSGTVLKGDRQHVRGLTAVPFEVVTLGNNHVFDHGVDAFEQTLFLLEEKGIKAVGAGMTPEEAKKPLMLEVNEIRIAVVSFSEGEDLTASEDGPGVFGWEVDEVIETINTVKATADIVIVVCHCGVEYIPFPPPYVAAAFQKIIDAGAHLVIGHHPHVPQGVQIYHQAPICYSLGNFVFYQPTDLYYRKVGYLVKAGLAKGGVVYLKLIPYGIHDQGLHLLESEERERFFEKMLAISAPLDDFSGIEKAWHGFLHYYGVDGLSNEIQTILSKLKAEPSKGAAMLRNRLTTMQHNQHWVDTLTRVMSNDLETSPKWAFDLAAEWLTFTGK